MTIEKPLSICFVGPFLGQRPGHVISQADTLAGMLKQEGYRVYLTSSAINPIVRLADVLYSLVSWSKQVDLILVMVFSGRSFILTDLSTVLGKALRLPIVLVLHGGALPDFSIQHPAWVRRVFRRAVLIVAPSAFLGQFFQKQGWQIDVIPNILPVEAYPYRERASLKPKLFWMRAFHDIYHPEMAIHVLGNLLPHFPEANLTMAGPDKGLLSSVKALAERLGVSGQVCFAGVLDEAGKRAEFERHDIYLNTSRVDNMPVTVIEAAACGLPVIATDVGGIPYLLKDRETGLLVDDGDVNGMVGAVREILADPLLARKLSIKGRKLAEKCAWPNIKPSWDEIFQRVVERCL